MCCLFHIDLNSLVGEKVKDFLGQVKEFRGYLGLNLFLFLFLDLYYYNFQMYFPQLAPYVDSVFSVFI